MDITLDKKSKTDGLIKIKVTPTDYQPKVEEKLREYARKANIKGFRQGKVPTGVIQKMYGKSILVEEVNHMLSHSINDYIKSNNLKVLGEPLPNHEKNSIIDWDHQKEFDFEFQIGMVDDFAVTLGPKIKLKSYSIKVDKKVIDDTLMDLKSRFGKQSHPETSEINDNLFGELISENPDDKKSGYIPIDKLNSKEQNRFVGLKKDDVINIQPASLFSDTKLVSSYLNLSEDEAKKGYDFKITTISRTEPAEINEELFDKVFGKGAVKTEEEFIQKIEQTVSDNYKRESDHFLEHEIQHELVDHIKITLPEDFLRDWLKATGEGKITDEVLEKEFNEYNTSLKWDLIKNKIAEDQKIKVEASDVKEKAKDMILEQFGGKAVADQIQDKLDAIADNYLSGEDGQNFMKLYNQMRSEKIMQKIKELITIDEKPISLDEFKKLTEKHHH